MYVYVLCSSKSNVFVTVCLTTLYVTMAKEEGHLGHVGRVCRGGGLGGHVGRKNTHDRTRAHIKSQLCLS